MSIASKKNNIYLDNAAATPMDLRVIKEVNAMMSLYGNPSSFNDIGRAARNKLDNSRLEVARFLGAHADEIIFTSSGSESNNLAISGIVGFFPKPAEILTTPIEHLSVLEPLEVLKKRGWKITYLKVDSEGLVDLEDLKNKLNSKVVLISVMYANNEIGTIQPVKKIGKTISDFRKKKLEIDEKAYPLFHTDACQAAGYVGLNVNELGVDLLTFNGTKIYGPRGAGVLYKRGGINFRPVIFGGSQEYGFRAGTENLPAIAGLAKAISLFNKKDSEKTVQLRDYFIEEIQRIIPDVRVNGPLGRNRLVNNINISIPGLDSDNLLLELDKYGIYAGSGSACTAHSVEPSHVLKAIRVEQKYLSGALRFSLGRQTARKDIENVLGLLPIVVGDLRKRYNRI